MVRWPPIPRTGTNSQPPSLRQACLIGWVLLAACLAPLSAAEPEFRAMWVDAWSGDFSTPAACSRLVEQARRGHFNALVVQVRRRGDAFYNSLLEPKAAGVAADFDPLLDLITKAHQTDAGQQRLEIHAWIVTYNIWNQLSTAPPVTSPPHPYSAHPDWVTQDSAGTRWDGSNYAFDPAHPAVQDYTWQVAMDLISRYDIDGLNFDYIRYAGPSWGYHPLAVARFNALQHRSGTPANTDAAWMQFRRDQVTALLRRIYLSALALKPRLRISADTITWAPGPATETAWFSSAAWVSVLQDWRGWMQEGILDLNIPMVYFDHATRSADFLNWSTFAKDHRYQRHVAIGPGLYLNTASNGLAQLRQFRVPTALGQRADGVCGYVYKELNAGNVVSQNVFLDALTAPSPYDGQSPPVFAERADPPGMPWKSNPTNGHVLGRVQSSSANQPLDGASVQLAGPVTRSVRSDANGWFGSVDLPPGAYVVSATFSNLLQMTTNTVVTAGQVLSLPLVLAPRPVDLLVTGVEAFPGRNEAMITWRLSALAQARVEYGGTTNLDQATPWQEASRPTYRVLLDGLTAGRSYYFRIAAQTPDGVWRTDAVQFQTAGELIVDDPQADFSGAWTTATSATDKYGSSYHYASTTTAGSPSATARYRPWIETPGHYSIYLWSPGGGNRSTNTLYEILHTDGLTTGRLDQTPQNAGWRLLARGLHFLRGTNGWVRLANATGESGKVIMADAVRWVYADDEEPAAPGSAPEWWVQAYFGQSVPVALDHDGDGYTAAEEYLLGTDPQDSASRLQFHAEWAGPSELLLRFTPWYATRQYQLRQRGALDMGTWQILADYPAAPTPGGGAAFQISPSAATIQLHQIQVSK